MSLFIAGMVVGVVLGIGLCIIHDAMNDETPADWHGDDDGH